FHVTGVQTCALPILGEFNPRHKTAELGFRQSIIGGQTQLYLRVAFVAHLNAGDGRLQVDDQVFGPSGQGGTDKEVGAVQVTVIGFHIIVGQSNGRSPVDVKGAGLEAAHAQLEDGFVGVANQTAVNDQFAVL